MRCLDEGSLQAYLDNELAAAQMRRAAGHLEVCAPCRDRLGRLEATLGRVTAWLGALALEDGLVEPVLPGAVPRIATQAAGVRWRWAAVALGGALAASAALFFAGARPRQEPAHAVQKEPEVRLVQPAARPPIQASVRRRAARLRRPKPRRAMEDFVAFEDADPMQMGMVFRVMLPASGATLTGGMQEIAADLVIGEDGRARAIRFVH